MFIYYYTKYTHMSGKRLCADTWGSSDMMRTSSLTACNVVLAACLAVDESNERLSTYEGKVKSDQLMIIILFNFS